MINTQFLRLLSLLSVTSPLTLSAKYVIPPPKNYAKSDYAINWERNIYPWYWNASKNVELNRHDMEVELTANKSLNGLKIVQFYGTSPTTPNNLINLNGYSLLIGAGGLINASEEQTIINNGILSSHTGSLKITNTVDTKNELLIEASITNTPGYSVSLNISSSSITSSKRIVALGGTQSNTFTGETTVIGQNILRLKKTIGSTAIAGDLRVKEGATVELYTSNQIRHTSRVTLTSYYHSDGPSEIVFKGKNITQSLHQLVIEGTGKIDFGDTWRSGKNTLYLDDLEIRGNGRLIITNWREGESFLLVHKDSVHLKDALSKIEFADGRKWGDLVSFDGEYYSISNVPEPAIFGAGVMAVGLGALAWKRKRIARRIA